MPKLGKCYSAQMAAEFARLGWTLRDVFRVDGDDEPYQYLFEWLAEANPLTPSIQVEPLISSRQPT
jgi:hypothetical protein